MDDLLARLEALLEKATPGPWHRTDWHVDDGPNQFAIVGERPENIAPGQTGIWPGGIVKMLVADVEYSNLPAENADLITEACNAMPALIAEIRSLRARLDAAEFGLHVARYFANNYLLDERDDADLCISDKHHDDVRALFEAIRDGEKN